MHNWRMALCLALAYVLTGYLGLQTPAYGTTITLVWLPTGIAVGFLLRWGYSTWPGIALGAFLVNVINGNSVPLTVGISVGNTLGPLLTRWILVRTGFATDLKRPLDILLLAVAAAAGMVITASMGVTSVLLPSWTCRTG
ncbi:MAG: hypothetical protein FJ304_01950 [Planctomycetes bacterium]|nr:hypothetical protein [Planctomycetota bacterium]